MMTGPEVTSGDRDTVGRLFALNLSGNSVFSVNLDGSDQRTLVTECRLPDGIVVTIADAPSMATLSHSGDRYEVI